MTVLADDDGAHRELVYRRQPQAPVAGVGEAPAAPEPLRRQAAIELDGQQRL